MSQPNEAFEPQTAPQEKSGTLDISITNFSGPLDLLLHLVKEEKIEIKDIFVSQVTEQFLAYITQLDKLDLDKASEYMSMAATLLEIKSRALLPEIPMTEQQSDSPESLLIRQLEEYKLFKEAGENLKRKENVDRLFKLPSPEASETVYAVKEMSLDNLLDAFAKIMCRIELSKLERANPKQIKKDDFSVAGKIKYIREKLSAKGEADFMEFCDESGEAGEVVVTFIALLELIKRQFVRAKQTDNFESIIVTAVNLGGILEYEEEFG